MEKENATILEVAPGLATSPVPSFAVVQAWYSRIRGAGTLDCGLALKLMACCAGDVIHPAERGLVRRR